ncbi:aa3-type cytochrome c oxidase subunit IV [Planktotalea sp.]|mgnify:FL=1|nr:aa3-type cytochrome c oxidase subunit IV [Planktotalea sp.]
MSDHKHGSMDTSVQEKTFEGFMKYVTWGAVVSIGILIFAALVNG